MKIAVTGAYGYSGQYIAKRLLTDGHRVITLTNSPRRENPFGDQVKPFPFHFDQPSRLTESLRDIDAIINTYWVRFDHRRFTHPMAVENTKILFQAAKRAGVRRIVHVSITNPDGHSALAYFSGKAELESELQALGLACCILRPAVLFGKEDVLINNIAWMLRHMPVFGVFGDGNYKLQPIYVDDLASAAVNQALANGNQILNAIGPETFTYRELVTTIQRAVGLKRRIISVPPTLGYLAGRLLGFFLRDVLITREEIRGLMENRLYVQDAPLGTTRLSGWIAEHRETLGRKYTSELARRTDLDSAYRSN